MCDTSQRTAACMRWIDRQVPVMSADARHNRPRTIKRAPHYATGIRFGFSISTVVEYALPDLGIKYE